MPINQLSLPRRPAAAGLEPISNPSFPVPARRRPNGLTRLAAVLIVANRMRRLKRKKSRRVRGACSASASRPSLLKKKTLAEPKTKARCCKPLVDPGTEQQLQAYEEALQHFQQQKYAKAKPLFEKVIAGPKKELADRARIHLRILRTAHAAPTSPSRRALPKSTISTAWP